MAQFSQPSNGPSVFTREDVQRLIQRLDAANRRIDEYAHLTASLIIELKQYRDIMCMSCKEKVLDASLHTTSLQQPGVNSPAPFSSQDDATFLRTLSEPTSITAAPSVPQSPFQTRSTGSEHSSPLSPSDHESNSSVETHSDNSFHTASQSVSTTDLPPSPSLMAPVEYNPEIKKPLDLSVVSILAVPAGVTSVTFSRDGRYFAVALTNEETHIYDMTTMSKSVLVDHGTLVIYSEAAAAAASASEELLSLWAVRFSPDTKSIATSGADGRIKIWEIKRKRVRTVFEEHASVTRIDFSPDGRFIASASIDGTVRMWCTRDGSSKYLSRPIGRDFAFNSVAFSPDGRYVAGGHDDQHLRIWAARTGHLLQKWEVHSEDLISVAFRPDGKRLASAGGGPEYAWRNSNVSSLQGQLPYSEHMVNDEEDFICTGHTGTIYSISFSPDGQWVLTSSLDHTSRIWEATTGAWVCSLTRHTAFVGASDFSPIGDYLVTGGGDGRVVLWKYREVEE